MANHRFIAFGVEIKAPTQTPTVPSSEGSIKTDLCSQSQIISKGTVLHVPLQKIIEDTINFGK